MTVTQRWKLAEEVIREHHAGHHIPQPCKVQHPDGSWSPCDVQTLLDVVEDARAGGGPVEQGPELFVPQHAGRIIPHGDPA